MQPAFRLAGDRSHAYVPMVVNQTSLDRAQRLMPDSVAYLSISASSWSEKDVLSRDATLFSSWATLLAPSTIDVIRGSRMDQAMAIWARDWPRRAAMSFSARIFSRLSDESRSSESDLCSVAREPDGTPFR